MYTLALLGSPGGNVDWTHSHHWFGCDFWRLTVWVPLFFKSPILITILSMLWDFPTNLIWEIQNPTEWNAVFQAIMLPSELGRNLSGIKGEGRRGSPWWISGLRSRREDWRSSRGQVWGCAYFFDPMCDFIHVLFLCLWFEMQMSSGYQERDI